VEMGGVEPPSKGTLYFGTTCVATNRHPVAGSYQVVLLCRQRPVTWPRSLFAFARVLHL